jgi:transcriptional regulator with XRE-family HTH domain
MTTETSFGRWLSARRRLLDLTQAQVAARCGLTYQQIQKYESGLTMLSVGRLFRLAEALQVPVCSLLECAAAPAALHAGPPEPVRGPARAP